MKSRIHFMTLAAVLVLTACSGNNDNPAGSWLQTLPESIRGLSGIEKFRTPIDYAEADNWLNVPATIDKDVDVFFIYPTCYLPQEATDPAVCDIVSWNTEGPLNDGHNNVVVKPNELCINPLNWRLDDTYAPVTENLGSLHNMTEQLVPAMADAQLNTQRGVVIVTTEEAAREAAIQPSMEQFFGPQCYHGWDYGLFYLNLRKNIADRIAAWKGK